MNDQERVDWVRMQADCLLHNLFKNLFAIVGEDLKQANCCSPFAKQGYEFVLDPDPLLNGHSIFTITRQPKPDAAPLIQAQPDNAWVKFTFKPGNQTIEIRRYEVATSEQKLLTVHAKWNHNSDTCGITIKEKPHANGEFYKPWQISREALSSLFFP